MATSSAIPDHLWSYADQLEQADFDFDQPLLYLAATYLQFGQKCGAYARAAGLVGGPVQVGGNSFLSGPILDACKDAEDYVASSQATDEQVRVVGKGFANADETLWNRAFGEFSSLVQLDDATVDSQIQGVLLAEQHAESQKDGAAIADAWLALSSSEGGPGGQTDAARSILAELRRHENDPWYLAGFFHELGGQQAAEMISWVRFWLPDANMASAIAHDLAHAYAVPNELDATFTKDFMAASPDGWTLNKLVAGLDSNRDAAARFVASWSGLPDMLDQLRSAVFYVDYSSSVKPADQVGAAQTGLNDMLIAAMQSGAVPSADVARDILGQVAAIHVDNTGGGIGGHATGDWHDMNLNQLQPAMTYLASNHIDLFANPSDAVTADRVLTCAERDDAGYKAVTDAVAAWAKSQLNPDWLNADDRDTRLVGWSSSTAHLMGLVVRQRAHQLSLKGQLDENSAKALFTGLDFATILIPEWHGAGKLVEWGFSEVSPLVEQWVSHHFDPTDTASELDKLEADMQAQLRTALVMSLEQSGKLPPPPAGMDSNAYLSKLATDPTSLDKYYDKGFASEALKLDDALRAGDGALHDQLTHVRVEDPDSTDN